MKFVVCDIGNVWTPKNKALDRYMEDVLIVTWQKDAKFYVGSSVFKVPYKQSFLGLGEKSDLQSNKYKSLEKVANQLYEMLKDEEDVIFLTDDNTETFYPLLALRPYSGELRMHLWTLEPHLSESMEKKMHYNMLREMTDFVQSTVRFNLQESLPRNFEKNQTVDMKKAYRDATERFCESMPDILIGILRQKKKYKYVYDFSQNKYVDKNRFDNRFRERIFRTPGIVLSPDHIQKSDETRDLERRDGKNIQHKVDHFFPEPPAVRNDGRQVCERLRKLRKATADANGIPFETEECFYIGPCAGTCPKCDEELAYLKRELEKIPEEQRIYPKTSPAEEE